MNGFQNLLSTSCAILQVVEEPEAASCIGPGCSNVAQPGSVYCGHECIIKHATATMKLMSEGKEQKPKEKTRVKVERSVALKSQPPVSLNEF